MSVATKRGFRKFVRDIFQSLLAVLAGGGGALLVDQFVTEVSPLVAGLMIMGAKWLATWAQNTLETAGSIKVMLPSPGLVPVAGTTDAVLADVVATSAPLSTEAGAVTGQVKDLSGEEVGSVGGTIDMTKEGQ